MDEKELIKAISEIKDEYVIDAAEAIENTAKETEQKPQAEKKNKQGWKLWVSAVAAVFALCIGVGSMGGNLFRMGRSYDAASTADTGYYYSEQSLVGYGNKSDSVKSVEAPSAAYDMAAAEAEYATDETVGTYDYDSINSVMDSSEAAHKGEVKLVKRAYLSVQTLEFTETEKTLKQLVDSLGGYFEASYQNNGGYYSDGSYKYGEYTVRIPAEKYDTFMNQVGEGCHISDLNESVEDIGEQYFDTESRLATLKTKLERLQELLSQAKDLSDIIALESEISNTEYEIDSYTSTLNRYDSLVGYATISVSISQVSRVDDGINNDNGFFAQLARRFKNGILNFIDSLADIAYWAAYNVLGIIIIVAAVVVIRKNHFIGKLRDKIRKRGASASCKADGDKSEE